MCRRITFDLKASYAVKGVALLMLLWHHLFHQKGYEFSLAVCASSMYAQSCVAMILILSGYGLALSVQHKPSGLLEFYKKRLPRLYLNYWFIALIFITIGVLFEYRPLEKVFPTYPYLKMLLQLTGIHMFISSVKYGYNATWWFISLVITLYLLFPVIYWLTKKYGPVFLLLCFLFNFPQGKGNDFLIVLPVWILTFAFGIYMALNNSIVKMSTMLKSTGFLRFVLLGGLIVLSIYIRNLLPSEYYRYIARNRQVFDWIYGTIVILFTFEVIQSFALAQRFLTFVGGHLFNVFLFHTFIYYYYWQDFIYNFKNPLLIFMVLFCICLLVSVIIEYIKKSLKFDLLLSRLDNIKIQDKILLE